MIIIFILYIKKINGMVYVSDANFPLRAHWRQLIIFVYLLGAKKKCLECDTVLLQELIPT